MVYYFVGQKNIFQEKSESLLLNILPKEIAAILKNESRTIADHYDEASVLFARLKETLVAGGPKLPYRELAAELDMTEGAVKVAVHRLRGAFRDALRREVSETVGGSDELEAELQDLIQALGSP